MATQQRGYRIAPPPENKEPGAIEGAGFITERGGFEPPVRLYNRTTI